MTLTPIDILSIILVVWVPFLSVFALTLLAKGILPDREEVDEFMSSHYPDLHARHLRNRDSQP